MLPDTVDVDREDAPPPNDMDIEDELTLSEKATELVHTCDSVPALLE